jgi:hypothetical protein
MANRCHYEKTIHSHRRSAGYASKKTFYRSYVLGFKEINGTMINQASGPATDNLEDGTPVPVNARAFDARIAEKDVLYKIDLCIYITAQLPHRTVRE